METWIGTSGYNYPEWKGHFYPADLAAAKMLPYYASRFRTVEINYTFYRMPTAKAVDGWLAADARHVPLHVEGAQADHPRQAAQGRRRPRPRLLRSRGRRSGPRLATLLFQLPPNLKCNLDVFDAFLDALPPKVPAAFEFRNASWLDDEVYERLRARNLALCIADTGEKTTPIVETADYGYFRLRDEGYQPADIERWAAEIAGARVTVAGGLRLFQARGRGQGARVRPGADASARPDQRRRRPDDHGLSPRQTTRARKSTAVRSAQ